ncbi:zeaxanthin epoxidase, chloroplastic isoform X2 [Hordeum vulgare subsp. vulgare]|uniref:zeaxanthin epoxidase, chloroplastic isoform X2 n=1 Tax=Hordeum vulgare subsp. vulgare TaxID=112509 RepID=UPI001D1A46DD|nr:zeaxanthin epoxidase, chloroplastic isoform X2 [Hordeum vulgare subsp. vulgare]
MLRPPRPFRGESVNSALTDRQRAYSAHHNPSLHFLARRFVMPSCTRVSRAGTAISAPPVTPSSSSSRTLIGLHALHSQRAPYGRGLRLSGPVRCAAEVVDDAAMHAPEPKPRVLVAGGGIGGLVFALAARRKGFQVLVLEKDMSAVRGEGKYRGPIQLQSNALAVLEAVDMPAADQIMDAGCITGDRVNGIVDGISGSWYIKFDTFTPAADRGLPVTRVISRMTLQQILARAVGDDAIMNDCHVVDFTDDGNKVTAILEDGRKFEGDLLVGADGIWSKVRKSLFGETDASYSEYTCYTGIADFVPPDIDTVGYRVFLGHKQYFVSSDVGGGKMQWYAFHKEPAGGTDPENGKKKRLLEIFSGWCDNVIDLLNATEEEAILRRDIYDRPPTINWGKGRVTLLGDSVHAMQPNLGQGGCMAIEDGYQLAVELEKAWEESVKSRTPVDVISSLRSYEKERKLRVAIIHGLARMAAIMATTYRPYLGVGLGPLSFLTKLRIPHPGRVGGRFFIKVGMPLMLSWVLGGNSSKLEGRPLSCRLSDKASDQLGRWFQDDDALEQAMGGEWYLFPMSSGDDSALQPIRLIRDEQRTLSIGKPDPSNSDSSLSLPLPQVSEIHATITCKNKGFYLTDLGSEHGTWFNDNEGRRYRLPPNFPVRFHPSDAIEFGSDKKAMFRVKVLSALPYDSARGGGEVLQAA